MRLSPRHAIAATAVSGAVLLGGAGWAAAQDADDAPTSTEADDGATSVPEDDAGTDSPEGRADRDPGAGQRGDRPEDCPDGASAPSGGDRAGDGDTSGEGSVDASAFAAA